MFFAICSTIFRSSTTTSCVHFWYFYKRQRIFVRRSYGNHAGRNCATERQSEELAHRTDDTQTHTGAMSANRRIFLVLIMRRKKRTFVRSMIIPSGVSYV